VVMAKALAFITPAMVRWARIRATASRSPNVTSQLAKRKTQLAAWEHGEALPTMRQAQDLARILNIPFGYLFLSSPPDETLPLPDFRAFGGEPPSEPSADLFDVINDVLAKQTWYREFQAEEGAEPLWFAGRFSESNEIPDVADNISKTLRVESSRSQSQTGDEFLRRLVSAAEAAGVLVMRTGIVSGNTRRPLRVKEFRGFAISDAIAPVIFVNGADAIAAQIFTTIHELAHIWIGSSGISNINHAKAPVPTHQTERFCNQVAAEVLVPKATFLDAWDSKADIDHNLHVLTRGFYVSSLVLLIRARDLELITKSEFDLHFEQQSGKRYPKRPKGGGNYYRNVVTRNSRTFTSIIVGAAIDGRVPLREAAQLLNVKVPMIQEIAQRLSTGKM
jgi:Zn-dependent peptidase ImmA (M78 family)/transcriptional regulator with XRE-family HTH domain